jgi:hypothetical protein
MADEYNRLAMYAAPVAPVENRLAQAVLPQGHPSNMLMWLRDQIPQVQADDTSTMSGITSRLGRTATAIPRAGLETMSNWLRGTHDPNAVRIGEDTIAPLGLFSMGTGLKGALTRPSHDQQIAARLGREYPEEVAGGAMREEGNRLVVSDGRREVTAVDPEVTRAWNAVGGQLRTPNQGRYHGMTPSNVNDVPVSGGTLHRENMYGGERAYVLGPDGATPATRTEGSIRRPYDIGVKLPGAGRPANDLLSDNAKSSVPGTVVNANEPSESSGVGDFLYRNFVNATEPLTSDENEWAQEIMGSSRLAKEDRLRAAEQFGRSAGKTLSQWVDYLPQEQARKGLKHLFEKYGTGGPIEDIPPATPANSTKQDDSPVLSILSKYGLY